MGYGATFGILGGAWPPWPPKSAYDSTASIALEVSLRFRLKYIVAVYI